METEGAGGTLKYTWDGDGNLATVKYPDGNTATYGYNSLDQMSSATDWLGHATGFKYDSAGNLSEIDYPNSTVSTYGYNSAEELDNITTKKSGSLDFEFDATGTGGLDANGNLKYMVTSQASGVSLTPGNSSTAGSDTFTYDPLSRVTADTQTGPSGTTNSTSEAYNNNGEATAEDSSSENNAVAYGTTGSDPGCISTVSTTGTFPYADVSCDKDGNRTCESNYSTCTSDPNATNFAYDGADRLTGVGFREAAPHCGAPSLPTAIECFSYDGNGELLSADFTATSTSNDQTLTWSTASGGVPTLAVDTSVINGSTQHTDFIDGPEGYPLEQVNVNGSTTTPDWYYQDPMGNTRVLLDSSGNVDQSYNYDDYGNWTAGTVTSGPTTPLLYQGDYADTVGTGFIFMQARWYDPSTGQFISRDPMVDQTLQPYAYAGDDPLGWDDPTGEYRYKYAWDIGSTRHTHSAKAVMRYLQRELNHVFPAPNSCSRIVSGKTCDLRLFDVSQGFLVAAGVCDPIFFFGVFCLPAALIAVGNAAYPNHVQVTNVRATQFTFHVLSGPFGKGDHITFSTGIRKDQPNQVYLTEQADAHRANPFLEWATAHIQPGGHPIEYYLWQKLCSNLAHHFGSHQTCQHPIVEQQDTP